ncbi:hypothetical protein RHSIM_Rhsim01G0128100 [Rhododendron simsii]|uniref:Uncharacterized protein n=1 Tax=Rhododendron simsii TaxID=118357 RepID=A0A834LX83_RHOSS|nr:hypothetical protein RHSIM_Rhsim01G0128100 [Rhododendron simsii]
MMREKERGRRKRTDRARKWREWALMMRLVSERTPQRLGARPMVAMGKQGTEHSWVASCSNAVYEGFSISLPDPMETGKSILDAIFNEDSVEDVQEVEMMDVEGELVEQDSQSDLGQNIGRDTRVLRDYWCSCSGKTRILQLHFENKLSIFGFYSVPSFLCRNVKVDACKRKKTYVVHTAVGCLMSGYIWLSALDDLIKEDILSLGHVVEWNYNFQLSAWLDNIVYHSCVRYNEEGVNLCWHLKYTTVHNVTEGEGKLCSNTTGKRLPFSSQGTKRICTQSQFEPANQVVKPHDMLALLVKTKWNYFDLINRFLSKKISRNTGREVRALDSTFKVESGFSSTRGREKALRDPKTRVAAAAKEVAEAKLKARVSEVAPRRG